MAVQLWTNGRDVVTGNMHFCRSARRCMFVHMATSHEHPDCVTPDSHVAATTAHTLMQLDRARLAWSRSCGMFCAENWPVSTPQNGIFATGVRSQKVSRCMSSMYRIELATAHPMSYRGAVGDV